MVSSQSAAESLAWAEAIDHDQYLALVAQSLEAATGESTVHAEWAAFSDRIDYVEVDALDSQTWDPCVRR